MKCIILFIAEPDESHSMLGNTKIVPGAVTFQNTESMTKVRIKNINIQSLLNIYFCLDVIS